MPVPSEFTAQSLRERSPKGTGLYADFLDNDDLGISLFEANPWLAAPDHDKPLPWDGDRYWKTTVARKHPYWSGITLPQPTKDIRQMRRDLLEWGYCLIEEAMSDTQCTTLYDRLVEQAAGEREAGVALGSPYGQYVSSLVNKGDCFARCIEQDPEAVQAGPVIEQLADEVLGRSWICHSFLAIGAERGRYPQRVHMDQGSLMPWIPAEAPVLLNTMYILQDVGEQNGGTLLIPGSHKTMVEGRRTGVIGALQPTVHLEAKAGTIMVFDGRLLHATGVNRTDKQRFVAIMGFIKPWMRQQENWVLTVKPEILRWASPKLLHRMGFQAVFNGGTVEGWGINYVKGQLGDPMAGIGAFRAAIDAGRYQRVGVLAPGASTVDPARDYTLRSVMATAKDAMGEAWVA